MILPGRSVSSMEPFSLIWSEEKSLMCEAFRGSATVEAWLKAHLEVDFVSRDRGKEFAKAATLGALQARASRWIVSIW
jgi:hypothetical protein